MNARAILLLTCLATSSTAFAQAENKPTVTTQDAQSLGFYPQRSAPAKVVALNHAKIPARIGGVIEQINFRVGDNVNQGDVIARLDCQDSKIALNQLTAEVKQAKTELAFKQRDLKRSEKLATQKSLTESEYDRKKTDVATGQAQTKALKARLEQQQLAVARCDIKAPFNGMLTQRMVSLGEQVNPGQGVVELLQSDNLEVSAQIALSDRQDFSNAAQYWLEVNQEKYPLNLRRVLPMVSNNSRSLESRFEFAAQTTYSGVTGRVKWRAPALHLPGYLLQRRGDQYGFFVLDGSKARFIAVSGASEGSPIELPSSDNFKVIIDGRYGLKNNDEVNHLKQQPSQLISTNQQ